MSARNCRSFLVGIIILNLMTSVALADPAPAPAAAPVTPADPEKLMAQAEKALDIEDLAAAIKLYTQAAELNYTPAQVAMADFLLTGEFYESALGWYLMAAMQGDADGQYGLAQMYHTGRGITKDEAKALYWYRRAAAQNHLQAIQLIAQAYRVGGFSGQIPVDPDRAKSWGDKALYLESVSKKAALKKSQEEAAKKSK